MFKIEQKTTEIKTQSQDKGCGCSSKAKVKASRLNVNKSHENIKILKNNIKRRFERSNIKFL